MQLALSLEVAPALPESSPATRTRPPEDAALLLDVRAPPWRVLYENDALDERCGAAPQSSVGRPFWEVFEAAGGKHEARYGMGHRWGGIGLAVRCERRRSLQESQQPARC